MSTQVPVMHTESAVAVATRPHADCAFRADVLAGLAGMPRAIPSRWLYDRRGSELFEDITRQPEYYPTRTERTILAEAAPAIAALAGLGPGGGRVRGRRLRQAPNPALRARAARLRADRSLRCVPAPVGSGAGAGFPPPAMKDPSILVQAYAAAGVAAFNRNLLYRINTEPEGTIPVGGFRHPARWNAAESRVAMQHLEATRHLAFSVARRAFSMVAGETIHTEISLKYRPEDARGLPRAAGWSPAMEWTDREDHFAVILARRSSAGAYRGIASPYTVDASRRGVLS